MIRTIVQNEDTSETATLEAASDSDISLINTKGEKEATWNMNDDFQVTIKMQVGACKGKQIKLPLCYIGDIYKLYKAYEQTLQPKHRTRFYREL